MVKVEEEEEYEDVAIRDMYILIDVVVAIEISITAAHQELIDARINFRDGNPGSSRLYPK